MRQPERPASSGPKSASARSSAPSESSSPMKRSRGITIIQFMFILLVAGIAAYWLVEYLRGRLA